MFQVPQKVFCPRVGPPTRTGITVGPGDAGRVLEWAPQGRAGDDAFGTYGLALGPGLDQSGISGVRPPPQTQAAASADHYGPGKPGPRTYRFSAQRVRATRRRKPGEELWAVWRRNLDGSEPRYYSSRGHNRRPTWVGRWRIETEFEEAQIRDPATTPAAKAGWSTLNPSLVLVLWWR